MDPELARARKREAEARARLAAVKQHRGNLEAAGHEVALKAAECSRQAARLRAEACTADDIEATLAAVVASTEQAQRYGKMVAVARQACEEGMLVPITAAASALNGAVAARQAVELRLETERIMAAKPGIPRDYAQREAEENLRMGTAQVRP